MKHTGKKKHKFDLKKLNVGDWFLGCPECYFQGETNTAFWPECPICKASLNTYEVEESDMKVSRVGKLKRQLEIAKEALRSILDEKNLIRVHSIKSHENIAKNALEKMEEYSL